MKTVYVLTMAGLHHSQEMVYLNSSDSWTNDLQEAKLFQELNCNLKELEEEYDCVTLSVLQNDDGTLSLY